MTESKLRIPRVALAVLVLGAACGDDEKGSDEGESGSDGGQHTGHDAGGDHEQSDGSAHASDGGGHEEEDAGGHDEADGGAHTEHDGGSAQDGGADDVINVSAARIRRVSEDFCAHGFRCGEEEVVNNFDDPAACVADSVMYWESYVETLGEECVDSQIDLYACAALLACDEEVDHVCHEQLAATEEACPVED